MKAAIYESYGLPEVLRIQETQKPAPKAKEVLVKVHAATVNRTDCAMLSGKPVIIRLLTGLKKPKNPILGTDFAGEVEAVGSAVTLYKVGDKVFGFDDLGVSSHAAYTVVSEDMAMLPIPEGIGYEEATASLEGAHYAYNFINKVNLQKGHKVLVNGASGAIGSAAVQLLKFSGAHVTAVCNTKNLDLIKSIGADELIDYEKEDFTDSKDKYHFVFDTVGKSSFGKSKHLLVSGGVYISSELGWMAQNPFLALLTPLFGGKKVKFPIPLDKKRSVLLMKKLIEKGKFKAVIDRTYPLEEVAKAFEYVKSGQKTGNVVITFDHNQQSS
jgi:NADPH:quinone reductase-like Zn-dependent oxidoreductase